MQPVQRHRRRGAPACIRPDPTALPSDPDPPVESSAVEPAAGRNRRNRRQPQRYREIPEDDGEEFDIHDHSDVSEEDTDSGTPGQCGQAIVVVNTGTPNGPNLLPTNRSTSNPMATVTDPLATNTSTSTSNKALDIEYFFRKEKEDTICKPCE
jgi:hypothetical protein